ncbi:MAG: carbamoyltransferase HypF [Pirellulaceae bacterium]
MNTTGTTVLRAARSLTLTGHVQGMGMRPAIVRFANSLSLAGSVVNTNDGIQIHIEGLRDAVERFIDGLQAQVPSNAVIETCRCNHASVKGLNAFIVKQETGLTNTAAISVHIPPDLVLCESCREEVADANDRRYAYPFTSCTDCGPRYSMIERMPYDRMHTSMAQFPLCDTCVQEYDSPTDRRFQAQSNACPDCGPRIWVRNANDQILAVGNDALRYAVAEILKGRIVALRGLGGYQLLADATSQTAVQRLRQRKGREEKPFAVMVSCLDEAEKLARLDPTERQILSSPAGPILIANYRDTTDLASAVTLGVGTVGLLMPTTPLHLLLSKYVRRPLVCTSGNAEGEPIVYDQRNALETLGPIADAWLEHDREIRRPIDDSVVRVIADRAVTFRLARGFAPMVLDCPQDEPMLAVGGQQKVALALSNGSQTVLGAHLGDMDTIPSRERFVFQVKELEDLVGVRNCRLVGDLHPDYFTTRWLESQSRPIIQVQHHHAHILSGMLEHRWLDRQVLGIAFDGTGYGNDGTIWGGEFFLCTASHFKRVGHLRPFSMAGGDQSVREPWRIATALVRDALGDAEAARLGFETGNVDPLLSLLRRPQLSPICTSAGRLFDGVSALILGIERCHYEGQAAILLESACDLSIEDAYPMPITSGARKVLDWRPMIRQIMHDRRYGEPPSAMAMRFHRGLASAIADVCRDYTSMPIVLAGGVFQNRVLVELLAQRMVETTLGLPGKIPPGDGGLAAGQLSIAAAIHKQGRRYACA